MVTNVASLPCKMDVLSFDFVLAAVCLLTLMILQDSQCGLISQSAIQSCQWGDDSEPAGTNGTTCKEKMVVSMTLKSGQGNTESLYANVRYAYLAGEEEANILKKPFRIEVSKSQTIASYRVYYRGSANGGPTEHTIRYRHKGNCRDGWNDPHTSCGKQNISGSTEYAWDSQGFCCRCNVKHLSYLRRPNASCGHLDIATLLWDGYIRHDDGNIEQFGSSAHCMRMNPLWYDVYDVNPPILQYTIHINLLEFNGMVENMETGESAANWTLVSSFEINPSKTISKSKDGRVIAELQGDLLGSSGPHDFSAKKLLIPSMKVFTKTDPKPAAYINGPSDWMLVDESLVDLSGRECSKVGTSFTAYRLQPTKCQQKPFSCFSNQPLQLWKSDHLLLENGKPGKYLLRNFGKVHPSTHSNDNSFILRFVHESLHNSFVTFNIDASDIQFVFNSVKGRIVDVNAEDFVALEENGLIIVEIENIGEISGEFTVTLAHCYDDRIPVSKTQTLMPGQFANVSFVFQAYTTQSEQLKCVVELYDKAFNLLGTSHAELKVDSSCFCYGQCGCSCDEIGNVTHFQCPTEPPVVIQGGSIVLRVILMVLRMIGAHGIVGSIGGALLSCGFIKLLCGGVVFCRKSKAQEYYDRQKERGGDVKGPKLMKCTGECRGAKLAQARHKRKVERVKKMGKDPYRLDDWRNTSFICNCNDELADIRFINIIKAVCFFYYCFFLPFIWLGRKIWWNVFRDTVDKKTAAKKAVIRRAKKQGKLEKYGVVDLGDEIKQMLKDNEKSILQEQKELTDKVIPFTGADEAKISTIDTVELGLPVASNVNADNGGGGTNKDRIVKGTKNKKGKKQVKDKKAKQGKKTKIARSKKEHSSGKEALRDQFPRKISNQGDCQGGFDVCNGEPRKVGKVDDLDVWDDVPSEIPKTKPKAPLKSMKQSENRTVANSDRGGREGKHSRPSHLQHVTPTKNSLSTSPQHPSPSQEQSYLGTRLSKHSIPSRKSHTSDTSEQNSFDYKLEETASKRHTLLSQQSVGENVRDHGDIETNVTRNTSHGSIRDEKNITNSDGSATDHDQSSTGNITSKLVSQASKLCLESLQKDPSHHNTATSQHRVLSCTSSASTHSKGSQTLEAIKSSKTDTSHTTIGSSEHTTQRFISSHITDSHHSMAKNSRSYDSTADDSSTDSHHSTADDSSTDSHHSTANDSSTDSHHSTANDSSTDSHHSTADDSSTDSHHSTADDSSTDSHHSTANDSSTDSHHSTADDSSTDSHQSNTSDDSNSDEESSSEGHTTSESSNESESSDSSQSESDDSDDSSSCSDSSLHSNHGVHSTTTTSGPVSYCSGSRSSTSASILNATIMSN